MTSADGDEAAVQADGTEMTRASLPEETAVDQDFDADLASSAILAESEERVNDPDAGISEGGEHQEHRRSDETL